MGNLQSNASSSTQITEKKYEVFLNFRGIDTRDGFTNYLYEALLRKSIETFRDEEKIPKGDEIWPTLLKAIRESKISVVIFSKEYASSKWCLRELVEIMECEKKNEQTVIPVFYKVSVHDVRCQQRSFKDGFDELEKTFEENLGKEQVDFARVKKRKKEFYEEMQNWRQALEVASHLKGWRVEGPESEVIDKLVKDIWAKLMRAYKLSPCDFKGLFGFEKRFKQVMSLLSLDNTDVRIIGIWGMGGIGKTTIANAIFHQILDDEYGKCFINVRQRLEKCGLVSVLQQYVLSKVFNDRDINLDDSVTLPQHIKERLYRKKVFIVLDDVDSKLEKLVGGLDGLGPGSRIVITTRNRDILRGCRVNDDYIYEVKKLSYPEAFQLFCEYAQPTKDLMGLSHEILQAIDGNPLGLKVAGSLLLDMNKLEWLSALSSLKKDPEILEVLQISYDRLKPEHQNTFLDIACFYVGEHKDYVVELLGNCSHSFKILFDRALITISSAKIIQMHDLLREMGREIVRKEDLNNPGNRSRLWTQEDVLDTLKNGYGTNAIKGIFLDMAKMNEEHLSSQAFKEMKNLRFLKFYNSTFLESSYDSYYLYGSKRDSSKLHFTNDISDLSNMLRSLKWFGYPWKAPPSNFIPENLVELDLSFSNIEKLWEDKLRAPKLKWIILKACPYLIKVSDGLNAPLLEKIDIEYCDSFLGFTSRNHFPALKYLHLKRCNKLTRISDFLDAPLLEKIDIQCCENLLRFPPPVDHFNNLHKLNMRGCKSLQSFPNNISFPSLVSLDLSGCINLARISDVLDAPLLEKIQLFECHNLLDFPRPAQHLNKLRKLNLIWCQRLQSLPSIIQFPSLTHLFLCGCINPIKISDLFYAPLLEEIDLYGCSALLEFSSPVDHVFNNLRELELTNCENLQSFGKNIHFPSLKYVDLSGCHSLTEFSDLSAAPLLEIINLENCNSLLHFPTPSQHFNKLRHLNMNFCKNLRSFPSDIHFPSLTDLKFHGCINLTMFPNISGNIKSLYMSNTAIHEVPSTIENLPELVKLYLIECTRLKLISTSICKFKALKELHLRNCSALECFPEILDTMESLEVLDLSGTTIKGLHHSIENLSGLEMLILRECKNLEMLPISIYNLTSLYTLDLSDCSKLENLLGNSVNELSNYGESATTKPPSWRLHGCELNFTNCLKLNKTAVINIMELQINQHRDMSTKGYGTEAVNLKFFYPGSEVPRWFNYQTDESSINIQMSSHDGVNGHLIGFAVCAIIEGYDFDFNISYWHHCHCKNLSSWAHSPMNNSIEVCCVNETLTDHVALWYSNASVPQLCGKCTNYLFEFYLQEYKNPNCRVKNCGVCPIYEKHNITLPSIANESCGAADQDFGETSIKEQGKIRKFSHKAETSGRSNEDVIEPHPKRTCN